MMRAEKAVSHVIHIPALDGVVELELEAAE